MSLYKNHFVSAEEYFQIREKNDAILEYIDGFIYMTPSPSTKHQRISTKLFLKLGNFLEGKDYEVFPAPYDIELKGDGMSGTKIVIPDINVICDKSGFTDTRYVGVPDLIVEILCPSNQAHDLVKKLNIYMNYGVREYCIINPMLHAIIMYTLNDEGVYEQHDLKIKTGIVTSIFLDSFSVDLQELF